MPKRHPWASRWKFILVCVVVAVPLAIWFPIPKDVQATINHYRPYFVFGFIGFIVIWAIIDTVYRKYRKTGGGG